MRPKTRLAVAVAAALGLSTAIVTASVAAPASATRLTGGTLAPVVHGISGRVGVAIGTDREGDAPQLFAGTLRIATSWSTSKVPIAMTALNHFPRSSYIEQLATRAITASDNDAAHALWMALGGNGASAHAVDVLLGRFGNRRTQFLPVHPGLSTWTLTQQVTFVSRLACASGTTATRMKYLMHHVIASERWGLGTWAGAAFKGGWGPDASGHYTVRQIGILPYRGRWTAVAIAVIPSDGTFATGTRDLTRITAWLWQHRAQLPSFTCTVSAPSQP